jgi:hypothetical protein
MVKMIENWVKVDGIINQILPAQSLAGFDDITIEVSKFEKVQSYPNLVEKAGQTALQIKLPHQKVMELGLDYGEKISGIVRAAPNQEYFFAENSVRKI